MEKDSVECVDIDHSVGGRQLFEGIHCQLSAGEMLLIQGRNGSGKSTLLRIMAGLITPDKGQVLWNGKPRESSSNPAWRPLYIGHKKAAKSSFTVAQMMHLWAELYHTHELLAAAEHYFDLEPYREVQCQNLSAGWQQKLALTRMILCPASLWLLDEPASHLDEESIALLQSLISARKEQGGMVAVAMHGKVESKDIKTIYIN